MKHARADYNRIQDPAKLIPDDEPVFLLRGQDKMAPATLNFYADKLEKAGGDPNLVWLTREQVRAMRKWKTRKMPDLASQGAKVTRATPPVVRKPSEHRSTIVLTTYDDQEDVDQGEPEARYSLRCDHDLFWSNDLDALLLAIKRRLSDPE